MSTVELHPGPKLYRVNWDPGQGAFIKTDVTNDSIRYLWHTIEFVGHVTLKDIFTLINQNINLYNEIIGNYCREIVEHALTKKPTEEQNQYDKFVLNWIYRTDYYWKDKKVETDLIELSGTNFPCLDLYGKDGTCYGIMASNPQNFLDIPVELKREVQIFDEGGFYEIKAEEVSKPNLNPKDYTSSYDYITYTLGDVIYGIIWEMSFYGSPQDAKEFADELKERVAEIDAGTAELIPWEEAMESIRQKIQDSSNREDDDF